MFIDKAASFRCVQKFEIVEHFAIVRCLHFAPNPRLIPKMCGSGNWHCVPSRVRLIWRTDWNLPPETTQQFNSASHGKLQVKVF